MRKTPFDTLWVKPDGLTVPLRPRVRRVDPSSTSALRPHFNRLVNGYKWIPHPLPPPCLRGRREAAPLRPFSRWPLRTARCGHPREVDEDRAQKGIAGLHPKHQDTEGPSTSGYTRSLPRTMKEDPRRSEKGLLNPRERE